MSERENERLRENKANLSSNYEKCIDNIEIDLNSISQIERDCPIRQISIDKDRE